MNDNGDDISSIQHAMPSVADVSIRLMFKKNCLDDF